MTPGRERFVVPPPTRTIAISDLVGEWGRKDGIDTTHVDPSTGVYIGSDSLHFTETWVIRSRGTISSAFFGLANGRKIVENATGSVTLSEAGILVTTMRRETSYVLRGWLEAPRMTVMTLNGPWYESIPADILTNPDQGTNLDQDWIRLKA